MTLREFLQEVNINVYEDCQGTLDLTIEMVLEDTEHDIEKIEINYTDETITIWPK
jgi:hypothetical protein